MRPADATRVAPVAVPPAAGGTGQYQRYDEPPRRAGWYIAGGLLALAVIVLGAILLIRAAQDGSGPGKVTMLDVRNMPLTQAQQQITNLGLKPTPVPRENDNVPVNQVYDQSPSPNQQVLKGSEVQLIYNSGRAKVTVPNLVGQTIAQATQTLTSLGLPNPQTTQQNSDNQPAGTVLAQDPAPGDVDAGSVVKLTVSGGVGKVDVPNVIGLDQATAANQLGARGFAVATTQEANQNVEAGKVIRTDPVPGSPLDKGQTVTIVVSTGKPQVDVPDVTNKTESDARNALQAAGFLQNVSYVDVPFGSNQDGKVITQNPPAGTKLAQGSTVTITVGRALPPPSTTAAPTTAPPRTTTTSAAGTTTTT
jgi:serine/threonine-protein kinase